MDALLLSERIILESLNESSKDFFQLLNDTKLNQQTLISSLGELIKRKFIRKEKYVFEIDFIALQDFYEKEKEGPKEELKELLEYFIESKFNTKSPMSNFKLKKVRMDKEEFKLYNFLLSRVEEFLNGLERENKSKSADICSLSEKKVVFWGQSDYKDIIDQIEKTYS